MQRSAPLARVIDLDRWCRRGDGCAYCGAAAAETTSDGIPTCRSCRFSAAHQAERRALVLEALRIADGEIRRSPHAHDLAQAVGAVRGALDLAVRITHEAEVPGAPASAPRHHRPGGAA